MNISIIPKDYLTDRTDFEQDITIMNPPFYVDGKHTWTQFIDKSRGSLIYAVIPHQPSMTYELEHEKLVPVIMFEKAKIKGALIKIEKDAKRIKIPKPVLKWDLEIVGIPAYPKKAREIKSDNFFVLPHGVYTDARLNSLFPENYKQWLVQGPDALRVFNLIKPGQWAEVLRGVSKKNYGHRANSLKSDVINFLNSLEA